MRSTVGKSQPITEFLVAFRREVFAKRWWLACSFALISIAVLLIGTRYPETYSAQARIKTAIPPTVDVRDQAKAVRDRITSARILDQVVDKLSLAKIPAEKIAMVDFITSHLDVREVSPELVQIEYSGSKASEVFDILSLTVEFFLDDILRSNIKRSEEAYLALEHREKLLERPLNELEAQLRQLEMTKTEVEEADVRSLISGTEQEIEAIKLQIDAAERQMESMESKLSHVPKFEGEPKERLVGAEDHSSEIAEAESRLANLKLNYTDDYPDVIALQAKIDELKQAQEPVFGVAKPYAEEITVLELKPNSKYIQLNALIEQVRVKLNARRQSVQLAVLQLDSAKNQLARILEHQAELADLSKKVELVRSDYERTLEKKRQASQAMVDLRQGMGSMYALSAPVNAPRRTADIQFPDFVAAGPVLGVVLPLLVLNIILLFEPSVRSAGRLRKHLPVPVLARIPHVATPQERKKAKIDVACLGCFFLLVMVAYLAIIERQAAGVF